MEVLLGWPSGGRGARLYKREEETDEEGGNSWFDGGNVGPEFEHSVSGACRRI